MTSDFFSSAMKVISSDAPTAAKLLLSEIYKNPQNAEAYYQLGNLEAAAGALEAACVLYKKALLIDPQHIKAWVNLSFRQHWAGNPEGAIEAANAAIALDITEYLAWINLSVSQSVLGLISDSLDSARRAVALRNNHETRLALAFANLFAGNLSEGLTFHEARFENQLPHLTAIPFPRWTAEDPSGKTILIISEQGIGDTLSFMRFVPLVAALAEKVYITVHPELLRLAAAAMAVYKNVVVAPIQAVYPTADLWTTFMSLPVPLRLSTAEIISQPDLFWPDFRCQVPFKNPYAKFHIGICWGGNKDCAIEKFRRIPLKLFQILANLPGVQLYSLQVGELQPEIHSTGFSTFIKDLSPYIKDVADTFGIVRQLDLVISAETAVGHIAGACGIPTHILYSLMGRDFRLGHEGKSIWYPNHKVFKQTETFSWEKQMQEIYSTLFSEI